MPRIVAGTIRRGGAPTIGRSRLARHWRLRLGQAVRRLSWGISDQAVSTVTNFAVSIVVVRSLSATQVGAFSITYVTYAVALNASRGLAAGPLMVRFTGAGFRIWRRAVADSTGTAAVLGLIASACVLASATLLGGAVRTDLLALGLTLPGLLLQDAWRYVFFARGRGSQAFLNDLVWAAALLPALGLVRAMGVSTSFWYILAWAAAANVAAIAGAIQTRVVPSLSGTRLWVSRHRDLGPRYLISGTSNAAASQLRAYGVGLMLGLNAVGYLQAASTLTGPITVLYLGMTMVSVPEGARVLRQAPGRMRQFCLLISGALAATSLAWGILMIVALPLGLGSWLLGPIWRPSYPLILPLTSSIVAQGACAGATIGLASLGAARRSLRVTLIASPLVVICALAGAGLAGAAGTLDGAAIASWLCAPLWWWQLRAALRESADGSGSPRLLPSQAGRHRKSAVIRSQWASVPVDLSSDS